MFRPAVFALVAACTGADDVSLDDDDSGRTDEEDCLGADAFVAGVERTSPLGRVVRIVDAAPNPPDVGDNTWTLAVTDGADPLPGLAPDLVPWMPLHGHGLTPPTYTATDAGDGTYPLPTFDLVMPGLWEFRVNTDPAAAEPDEVLFTFCAEG